MRKRRKNLPLWVLLLIWLVMGIGFTVYNWRLVGQDKAIAPREQVVLGSIYRTTHWKQNKAFYSFKYAGRKYRGSEMVGPDKMCLCDVAVYFDPTHPSTNSLIEYRQKSKQDHKIMVGCGYASGVLAATLACALAVKKKRGKLVSDELQAGNLS